MNFWRSAWGLYPDRNASMQREQRLTTAYNNVFRGNPSKECQELVLADLAYHSGFSMVTPPKETADVLRHNEGKRTLFAQIWSRLNLSPDDRMAIENAARREAMMSTEYQIN